MGKDAAVYTGSFFVCFRRIFECTDTPRLGLSPSAVLWTAHSAKKKKKKERERERERERKRPADSGRGAVPGEGPPLMLAEEEEERKSSQPANQLVANDTFYSLIVPEP